MDKLNVEIMPSEKLPIKNIKQDDKLPSYLAKRALIILQGCAGSGKTSVLYSMLKQYQKTNYFDVMIFYNRVSDSNWVWESFAKEDKTDVEIFSRYDNAELLDMVQAIDDEASSEREMFPAKKRRLKNVAFIFDDMIYSGICSSHRQSALDELTINRRHLNCSIFITSQSYRSLNQNIRANNVSQVIIIRANTKDLENIASEHNVGVVDTKKFMDMYNRCKEKGEYEFMVVDYNKPLGEVFSCGFNDVLIP